MNSLKKVIIQSLEHTFETVVKKDSEYAALEKEKLKIMENLQGKLDKEVFQQVEKIIDCMDGQNFLTMMGFSFVRVLDLNRFLG